MGLDISHDTWHGAYSAFHRWRSVIAMAAGLPPLDLMEGFYSKDSNNPLTLLNYKYPIGDELDMAHLRRIFEQLPIKWESLKPMHLHELLYHSDCDGEISYGKCGKIANELEAILDKLPDGEGGGHIGNWRDKTKQFITGLRDANKKKQTLHFR